MIAYCNRVLRSHRFKRFRRACTFKDIIRQSGRRARRDNLTVVVGSAHRVGSTWLDQMLEDLLIPVWDVNGLLIPKRYRAGEAANFTGEGAVPYLASLCGWHQFKTHHDLPENIPHDTKVITVHRDLRDMSVSMTHFVTNLSEEAGGFPPEVKELPFPQRLEHVLKTDYCIKRAEYWWCFAPALRVRYEDLKEDSVRELTRIEEYCDARWGQERIQEVAQWHDFGRRSGRKPGQADQKSFLRKGIVGDWASNFGPEQVDVFKTALDGRWNKLLVEMGYEATPDW